MTNDVDHTNPSEIEANFRKLLDLSRDLCHGAEIYFSSVMVRRSRKQRVAEVNNFLWRIASETSCYIIDHRNIDSSLLKDEKNLKKTRFFLFLANIRYVVFGKTSKLYRS